MEGLKVQVSKNTIQVTPYLDLITSGTIGLTAEFTFSSEWQHLTKLAVFKAGSVVKTVKIVDNAVVVPWEVLDKPNVLLRIGVYGVNPDCTLAIPTIWADVSKVYPGADPNADPAMDPTLPVWQDLINRIEDLEESGGGSGEPGQDGFSPIAKVEQTAEGAVISITDKYGTTTTTVTNGKDGKDGEDGIDGKDGQDGQPGKDGAPGADGKDGSPGKDGADGYTPVRGTDYWTPADIAEIKGYVDEAILGGAW